MSEYSILIVEDEENLQKTIQFNLELEGYNVLAVSDGIAALKKIRENNFHLIILDVMLPELSGYDVCEEIRKSNESVAILFLTAKASSQDRIKGLRLGADDYLAKPFNLEELLLRVTILLKRTNAPVKTTIDLSIFKFGNNQIDFVTFEISSAYGNKIQLSKKEIALLKLLIERKGEVVSRENILDNVWGKDVFPSTRTIDNYIVTFRKLFEQNQRKPKHFHSIRGVGYKFTV